LHNELKIRKPNRTRNIYEGFPVNRINLICKYTFLVSVIELSSTKYTCKQVKRFKLFIFLSFALTIKANALQDTLSAKYGVDKIIYGFDQRYEPYEFIDDDGASTGFNIDLIRAIAKELDMDVELKGGVWRNVRKQLEVNDEVNVAAYFKSDERLKKVLYSKPISVVYYSIFSGKDSEPVEDLIEISNKKVAIQENSIVEEYFNQFGFIDEDLIYTYDSEVEALEAVINGETDCAITSYFTTNYEMQAGNYQSLKSSSDPIFITEYCYVVTNNRKQFLDSLNWGLRLVKASGEYDKLYQKWLTPKKGWWERNARWVFIGLIILLAIIIFIAFWIYLLRKQVTKKSEKIKQELKSRIEVEADLQESELLRKKTEEFSSVMLIQQNLDHQITLAPKALSKLLAFEDSEELLGLSIHQLMTKQDKNHDLYIKDQLQTGAFKFIDSEIGLKTLTNEILWIKCSTSLLKDDQDHLIGYVQFMRDVTPLKKANTSLIELNAELANFMYKTSHDVRGPIANILGLTELGRMVSKDEELTNYFNLVEHSTKKLELIFDDFKEVSFILSGNLNYSTFDVKELCREVFESVFRKRNKDLNRAKIQLQVSDDVKLITTDRTLLKRFIYQVTENAFEHNTYYETNFIAQLELKEDFYHFTFIDDGIGIPKEIHNKVFEVFFKGKRSDINIGMGLYMAKKVMNKLGGDLKLISGKDEGTKIIAIFPKQKSSQS